VSVFPFFLFAFPFFTEMGAYLLVYPEDALHSELECAHNKTRMRIFLLKKFLRGGSNRV